MTSCYHSGHRSLPFQTYWKTEHFGALSNLKVNYAKLHALNISLSTQDTECCQSSFPFRWEREAITYLGIRITTKLSDLYKLNLHVLLNKTKSDLKDWAGLNVSWFGRSALLKMTIFPRFLYLMQTIPIHLPTAFFTTYRQACSLFIWKNSPPRIKYTQLTRTKTKGGIGLPDLYKYYLACHLTRIVDWNIHYDKKLWVCIENSFTQFPVQDLPWLSPRHWPTVL